MDVAIKDFLAERKEGWLKKNAKDNLSESEKAVLQQEADEKFNLKTWLPDAAKRAGQLSLSTHPSKFSHPSSKSSMILADPPPAQDGFLRSGNLTVEPDVLGNAAAMDVYKFLSLKMQDDQSILQHLQQRSEYIQAELSIETASFEELYQGLMAIQKSESQPLTHERVKQVYFPVADEYHLLSLLTPSGLVFALKDRLQELRFSEETKAAREDKKAQRHNPTGYAEFYGLAMIGYGGTKPQNISVLNSQNGGKAYLLPSLPPRMEKRRIRFPKNNFFSDTLWLKPFHDSFMALHKIFSQDQNNHKVRQKKDQLLLFILAQVIKKAWEIQAQAGGWSQSETYLHLPLSQKIWLDDSYKNERVAQDEWLNEVLDNFLRWLVGSYEKTLKTSGQQTILLSDDEIKDFKHRLFLPHREDFR